MAVMGDKNKILTGIDKDIRDLLYGYIKAQSFTYTAGEKDAERFLMGYLSEIPYFKEHPEHYGAYKIPGDPFGRAVCYAMVRGTGNDTVVFVHHNDVVDVEDFKLLKPLAFSPDELGKALFDMKNSLHEEARLDLESGRFLFGRGGADMKGGGSIQLSLLRRYSQLKDFRGNVIVIAVPDEENLSAGMRAGVRLLAGLRDKYGLDYKLMINSEPHQRKNPDEGIFSEGSVGKLMPFIYVRGYLSHIGKVFEGFNPVNLMSEIVRRTELNMDFSDVVGGESAPPPTWLYMKDSKNHYDVSTPLSASGCFSILTLDQTPKAVMDKVAEICRKSFEKVISDMNRSYSRFTEVAEPVASELPWKTCVMDCSSLYGEAERAYGNRFTDDYDEMLGTLGKRIAAGECNLMEANFQVIEFIFNYIDDLSPRVVYGLIPPYYPNVSNIFFKDVDERVTGLSETLDRCAFEAYGQHYTREFFYTGISDLSYTSIRSGEETREALEKSMPLFGRFYDIPVSDIEKISMPCINIGPWGKDFHKLTERVLKDDLFERTPRLLNQAVALVLNDPALTQDS